MAGLLDGRDAIGFGDGLSVGHNAIARNTIAAPTAITVSLVDRARAGCVGGTILERRAFGIQI